jgi:hypothetical protein
MNEPLIWLRAGSITLSSPPFIFLASKIKNSIKHKKQMCFIGLRYPSENRDLELQNDVIADELFLLVQIVLITIYQPVISN